MQYTNQPAVPEEMPGDGFVAPDLSSTQSGGGRAGGRGGGSGNGGGDPAFEAFKVRLEKGGGITFTPEDSNAARTIPAEWLEKLASDGTIDVAVRINFAIIAGDLALRHKVFMRGLSITESEFKGDVNFSFATFERGVNLTASCFERKADFRAMRAKKDFHLPLACFDGYACFEDIYVEEVFSAEGAVFSEVDFNRGSFSKSALFCSALVKDGGLVPTRFRGKTDFSDAVFHGPIFFKGARFYRKAFFDGIRAESVSFFSCDAPDDVRVNHKIHRLDQPECKAGRRLARLERKAGSRALLCTQFRRKATFIGTRFGSSVTFSGARFEGKADFRRVEIDGTALFNPYTQKGKDTFKPVSFGGDALFWSARIKGAARFESARFEKCADFERVAIGGRAYFCRERNGGLDNPPVFFGGRVNFVDASVEGCTEFDGVQFKDEVDFERAQVGGCVFFRAVEHRGEVVPASFGEKANFISMTVRGSAEFNGAKFDAEADFSRVSIEGRVLFCPYYASDGSVVETVSFGGVANFRDATVKSSVQFDGADFKGDAVFKRLQTDGNILFRCTMRQPGGGAPKQVLPTMFHGKAQFESVSVRGNAEFDGAHFLKAVTFERAQVGGNLYFRPWMSRANPTRFRNKSVFIGMKVVGDAEFSSARFHENADFTGLVVGGQTYFDAVLHYDESDDPNNKPEERKFKSVAFGGEVRFNGANFANQVDFKKARFQKKADFTGVRGESMISFEEAVFHSHAIFREARFTFMFFDRPNLKEKSVTARAKLKLSWLMTRLSKRLQASRVTFLRRPARAIAHVLKAPEPELGQFRGSVDLRGCTYERIEVKLRPWIDKLVVGSDGARYREGYDRQPFTQLIKALRAAGDDRRADFVYLRQRGFERQNTWSRAAADFKDGLWWKATRNYFNYAIDWFFWHAGNYGVQPERLFYISLGIILVSAFVFSLKGAVKPRETDLSVLELHTTKSMPEGQVMKFKTQIETGELDFYPEALKLSLSQFIPIIDISPGIRWTPSDERLLGRWYTFDMYASIHRLLGAITVPLLLAAIAAGLYRRVQSNL